MKTFLAVTLNVIFLDSQHVHFHTNISYNAYVAVNHFSVLLCLREIFNQFDLLHFPYVKNGKIFLWMRTIFFNSLSLFLPYQRCFLRFFVFQMWIVRTHTAEYTNICICSRVCCSALYSIMLYILYTYISATKPRGCHAMQGVRGVGKYVFAPQQQTSYLVVCFAAEAHWKSSSHIRGSFYIFVYRVYMINIHIRDHCGYTLQFCNWINYTFSAKAFVWYLMRARANECAGGLSEWMRNGWNGCINIMKSFLWNVKVWFVKFNCTIYSVAMRTHRHIYWAYVFLCEFNFWCRLHLFVFLWIEIFRLDTLNTFCMYILLRWCE